MSFQAMAWALKQPGKTNEKFLLIVIANYADERGQAWPSIERLCADTGMSRATVQRTLRKLEKSGFVTCHKRIKGRLQTSNLYALRGKIP
jgi:DNA-binding transcriptional regulator YhcF (GntR family)